MQKIKSRNLNPDPFPIEKLGELKFGNADGHRDEVADHTFINTYSVRKFLMNNHSIIVGAIGAGKSTLFRHLKRYSTKLDNYENDLIVPIEEAMEFSELNQFAKKHFANSNENNLYQLLWKFNILLRISVKISEFENFPHGKYEIRIKNFLKVSKGNEEYKNVVDKLKTFVASVIPFKFEATIGDKPVKLNLGNKSAEELVELNLDSVQKDISQVIQLRNFKRVTVLIDKIDKFVAGEEYKTQKKFINSLLEVDDDLSSNDQINLKIFLRSDLFERLDFASLGYDKVCDNAVMLKWSHDETIRFIAKRLLFALDYADIVKPESLLQATDLSEFDLTFWQKISINPKVPAFFRNIVLKFSKSNEREISLFGKFDKSIITKVFPRNTIHFDPTKNDFNSIDIFKFIESHFLDGNGISTPRFMLVFLKEVVEKTIEYYIDNPDQFSQVVKNGKDYEWDLFKEKCVYKAYISSKNVYLKNIASVDAKWKRFFKMLLAKRGNKTNFDYKWIRANIANLNEHEAIDFLSFLQVIGFLKIIDQHPDIKKRKYELPILYKKSPKLN